MSAAFHKNTEVFFKKNNYKGLMIKTPKFMPTAMLICGAI